MDHLISDKVNVSNSATWADRWDGSLADPTTEKEVTTEYATNGSTF